MAAVYLISLVFGLEKGDHVLESSPIIVQEVVERILHCGATMNNCHVQQALPIGRLDLPVRRLVMDVMALCATSGFADVMCTFTSSMAPNRLSRSRPVGAESS
jgi:hypothetical protein